MWRLHTRGTGGWLHVLVLLEFQSTTDSAMALRVLEYTALLYGEMLRRGIARPGALPPVLPVVLYNGDSPWSPALEMRELITAPPPALRRASRASATSCLTSGTRRPKISSCTN